MQKIEPPLLVKRGSTSDVGCIVSGSSAQSRPVRDCLCAACCWHEAVERWGAPENHRSPASTRQATKRAQQLAWNLTVAEELEQDGSRRAHVRVPGMRPASRSWRWTWVAYAGSRATRATRFSPHPLPSEQLDERFAGAANPWPRASEPGLWWQVQRLRQVIEAMDELDRDKPGRTRGLKALYRIDLESLQTHAGALERSRRAALGELRRRVSALVSAGTSLSGTWEEGQGGGRNSGEDSTPRSSGNRRNIRPLDLGLD